MLFFTKKKQVPAEMGALREEVMALREEMAVHRINRKEITANRIQDLETLQGEIEALRAETDAKLQAIHTAIVTPGTPDQRVRPMGVK